MIQLRVKLSAALLSAAICLAQSSASLKISGSIPSPISLTASDLAQMEHVSVTYHDAGKTTVYQGVPVEAVLKKAGAPLNLPHGGKTMRLCVVATAKDGYQVVYALAEFDSSVVNNPPVIADQSEGKPLGEKVGPFRLVMPNEKKGARSIRMLENLEIVDVNSMPK